MARRPQGEGGQALGNDHEFLEINGGVGMGAAVDDVGHGDGEDFGVGAAEVLEQRQAQIGGGGLGVGQGDGQDGVGAEDGFGFRAVQLDHGAVQGELIQGIQAADGGEDFVGDVFDGFGDAFAEETALVAVAQFEGLVFAGAGAGGDSGAAGGAAGEEDVHFDGWVAAGIKDFARFDVRNSAHGFCDLDSVFCINHNCSLRTFHGGLCQRGRKSARGKGSANASKLWRVSDAGRGARPAAPRKQEVSSPGRIGVAEKFLGGPEHGVGDRHPQIHPVMAAGDQTRSGGKVVEKRASWFLEGEDSGIIALAGFLDALGGCGVGGKPAGGLVQECQAGLLVEARGETLLELLEKIRQAVGHLMPCAQKLTESLIRQFLDHHLLAQSEEQTLQPRGACHGHGAFVRVELHLARQEAACDMAGHHEEGKHFLESQTAKWAHSTINWSRPSCTELAHCANASSHVSRS